MTGAVVVSGGRSSLNPPLQTLLSPEPPTPNTLVELKDLPVILQEHWALSNPGPLPKLHPLSRTPFPTPTAWPSPHSTSKAELMSPPQHAFLTALLLSCRTELLPLYHSTHEWLPLAHPNFLKKGEIFGEPDPSDSKALCVFGICATRQPSAKSKLPDIIDMSHTWLWRVETQLVQTEMAVKLDTHSIYKLG